MSHSQLITLHSDTGGLWGRMITQLISTWVAIPLCVFFFSGFSFGPIYHLLILIAGLAMLGYWTFRTLRDHPRTWRNEVAFDFKERTITILGAKGSSKSLDVLDEAFQQVIPFDGIEQLRGEVYESFLFSSYYRISVLYNGQRVKLLSLKAPNVYSDILGRFRKAGILVG